MLERSESATDLAMLRAASVRAEMSSAGTVAAVVSAECADAGEGAVTSMAADGLPEALALPVLDAA